MVTVSIIHTASKPAIQRFFIAVPLSFLGFVLFIVSSPLPGTRCTKQPRKLANHAEYSTPPDFIQPFVL